MPAPLKCVHALTIDTGVLCGGHSADPMSPLFHNLTHLYLVDKYFQVRWLGAALWDSFALIPHVAFHHHLPKTFSSCEDTQLQCILLRTKVSAEGFPPRR
jgi:hypothetical protein